MKTREECELNKKTYGPAHYRRLGKKSHPCKLRVEIAAQCSRWWEAGNAVGQLVTPGCGGRELAGGGLAASLLMQRKVRQILNTEQLTGPS